MRKTVVLDACVLYAAHLRDFLLHLALQKLYNPRWTDRINEEWIRNVLKNRPDLSESNFARLLELMNETFPRANVKNIKLSDELNLPDPDDIHVLAAAIHCKAELIVTFNIKDFPSNELAKYGIKAVHPDEFLKSLIEENPIKVTQAFSNQVESLKNPPISTSEILERFRKTQLTRTANLLRSLL